MIFESESRSLLIADDDAIWRSTLREIFEPSGYEIVQAESGREAISIVENRQIDCMLLDMHMPDISGLETLRIVRQVHLTLPCIVVTSDANQQILRKALSLHAFTVLTKPVSRGLVTVTVRRALESIHRSA